MSMIFNLKGYRPEPDSHRHRLFEDTLQGRMALTAADKNGDVDLRPFTSGRHNQRNTSTCVAQAVCKALEIKRIMRHGRNAHVDLSRLAVYWFARNLMDPKETHLDEGTYISHAFDAIRRFGVPPEKDWAWDLSRIYDAPTWAAMRRAYVAKIISFYKISSRGQDRVDAVIQALQAGNPVVFGTTVDSTWFNYAAGSPILKPVSKQNAAGRHATVLVGHINGVFVGENSWGSGWGSDGFYFMDPAAIAASEAQDFWVPQAGWEALKE